ncbi:MAG: NRDE family protein [Deltaproteobacteria bacterium]|jgi:uncharacterized protein with NRDE domain|nr:NRDE family protein [Deltaproteobacteria bacterium]MBW2535779.1 NRDE family protein [Deltaproteobacteria bacterium]
MCTIIVLRGVVPELPLVVAANRDELYAREAEGPAVVAEVPRIVAGRDRALGGSWLGANERGIFVGLTNQRTFQPPDPERRSRGEVVLDLLRQTSVEGVRRGIARLDPGAYNPFNLVYGDAEQVEVAYVRPTAARAELERPAGAVVVLCNDRLGSPEFPKASRAAALVRAIEATGWDQWARALATVLADHALPEAEALAEPPADSVISEDLLRQLGALCIHTPTYGTCSATLLGLAPGRAVHYAYADGPPCTTRFVSCSHLLER